MKIVALVPDLTRESNQPLIMGIDGPHPVEHCAQNRWVYARHLGDLVLAFAANPPPQHLRPRPLRQIHRHSKKKQCLQL